MTDDERKLLHAVEMGAGALRAIAVHEVLKERDRLAADLAGEAEGRRLANEALIVREHDLADAVCERNRLQNELHACREAKQQTEAALDRLHSEYATAYKEWQKTADAWKDRAEKAEADLSKAKAALGVAVRTIGRLAEDILADEVDAVIADDPPKGGA